MRGRRGCDARRVRETWKELHERAPASCARRRYRDLAPKLDFSQLNFIVLHIRLTGRNYRAPCYGLFRYRIDKSITPLYSVSCPLPPPTILFCCHFFLIFFLVWVTRYLSMQDGCNPSGKSPLVPLTTVFHDCNPQAHHNLDGPRRNCEWLSGTLHPHRQCVPRTFSLPIECQPHTRLSVVGSASTILQ